MQSHNEFLHQMGLSLKDADSPCPSQVIEQQANQQSRRFNIYRNNRTVSLVDNLKATYPVVLKLLGEKYFTAVACHYIEIHPPEGPVMAEYGGSFGYFLAQLPNTKSVPYIKDVALLEWARLQAYHAMDATVLLISTLVNIAPKDYETLCFNKHPSLSMVPSKWPVGSLWKAVTANVEDDSKAAFSLNKGEHVLVVRPILEVTIDVLPSSAAMLLDKLQQGIALVDSVEQVAGEYPTFDPGSQLQRLIELGCFESTYRKDDLSD